MFIIRVFIFVIFVYRVVVVVVVKYMVLLCVVEVFEVGGFGYCIGWQRLLSWWWEKFVKIFVSGRIIGLVFFGEFDVEVNVYVIKIVVLV